VLAAGPGGRQADPTNPGSKNQAGTAGGSALRQQAGRQSRQAAARSGIRKRGSKRQAGSCGGRGERNGAERTRQVTDRNGRSR